MRIEKTPLGTVFCSFDGSVDAAVAMQSMVGEAPKESRDAFVNDIRTGWTIPDHTIRLEFPEDRLPAVGRHLEDRLHRLGAAGVIHGTEVTPDYDQTERLITPRIAGFALNKLLASIEAHQVEHEQPPVEQLVS